jgi:4-methylaminobutanoate oxidase (formaldehyde-forming)
MTTLPSHARAVIIGGGIIGCSTAYHLARLGWDTVILERKKLTSGSTFHAAGLVGQLRSSANITQLLKYSVELYDTLEQETELGTGWKRNGGLRLACTPERLTEIKRLCTMGRSFDLPMELLSPKEARDLWPLLEIKDVIGAVYLPTDGQANPSDITQALAKGARMKGVKIIEDCEVTAIMQHGGRVTGVRTSLGDVGCEVVVNCGGQWARELGLLAGVSVPVQSVEHQYMITKPFGVPRDLPTLRDPDKLIYFKEEVGGLCMGGYEHDPIPWAKKGIPRDFHFQLLDANWEHFEPLMQAALARVPALEDVGVIKLINGPEAFTPDGNFILGEAPELHNYYVGAGFNAFGIASAGGAGRALAEWIAAGEPPMDLWPVDIRRFGGVHRDPAFVMARTLESYGHHYAIAWPNEELVSGRPLRTSSLYGRLAAQGAVFGWKMGWERPNWFAPEGTPREDVYSFERPNWFAHVGREHEATRERCGVCDASSFAKFLVVGRDAQAALDWICANDVHKPVSALTYTQMLNKKGGIECDLTVSKIADDTFYLVTGTGFGTHDLAWIRGAVPEGLQAQVVDVTSAYAVLALMGPRARDILTEVTRDDVSNAAFPFATARELTICGARVRALRVTYVGELGWELHVPTESAPAVYDALMEAGRPHGLVNTGYRATESLRLEKGYRAWGQDIGPDYSALEAGLGWAVKLKKEIPFLGRDALVAQAKEPLRRRLAGFTVDDPDAFLFGRETIYRDGQRVGWITGGGWGYTVGKMIGYGYVRERAGVTDAYLTSGTYELEVATRRVPAKIHLGPLHDPRMERIKA